MRRVQIGVLVLALVCCSAVVWKLRGRSMAHYLDTQTYEDIYYLPPPAWLQVMSLGYERALADLIWMRALVYFGDEFRNQGAVRHVFHYGDALLTLDPDFKRVYRWVGMAGLYTPTGSSLQFMERAVEVLRQGADRFPDDGQLAWEAGATIAYELIPNLPKDDPQRERLKQDANEYMIAAARLGGGPDWLVITNATELGKLGEFDRELRHLEEMYAIVRDPGVKQQIEYRITALRSASYAEAFRHANEEFEARRQAELPYVPAALYFFLAEPIELAASFEDLEGAPSEE